jgi:hypothetical protein
MDSSKALAEEKALVLGRMIKAIMYTPSTRVIDLGLYSTNLEDLITGITAIQSV